ncbi:MAG: SPASM domain-containing protein [Acholeplasmataceae bacterium]|nr:SPASM domain-containing protein [Acholeplasmataceae bacterium]
MNYEIFDFNNSKLLISLINGNQVILNQEQYQKLKQSELNILKDNHMLDTIDELKAYNHDLFKTVYISLHTSSQCNLACTYCFKKTRDSDQMKIEEAKRFIDDIIKLHPNAEKYIVDPTGSGEPLLDLDLICDIGDYCKQKSDEVRKEVLPMLVTNGTLLTLDAVDRLRIAGILFGVSVDGIKKAHDLNRIDYNGVGTHKTILKNIKRIKDRTLLGAAVTLTNSNKDLVQTMKHLIKYFPAISIKPVRSSNGIGGICEDNIEEIKEEYSKLCSFLVKKTLGGDLSYISALLNGDDYLGKFILRVILNQKVQTRCDAGLGRYSLAADGKIYTCPAAIDIKELEIGNLKMGIDTQKQQVIWKVLSERNKCGQCIAKYVCGGECMITSYYAHGKIDELDAVMCDLKRHLYISAVKFKFAIALQNKDVYKTIKCGCIEKSNRFKEDEDLKKVLDAKIDDYTFTELKRIKDEDHNEFNRIKATI